ncbi:uncharacterized protein FSUBG_3940 [Fusarium subglutinans]|uniref:Uncharacterized protein n=1 Tax=Gibberella subglutinans TaxID=42677 RepID=A0A8H5V3Q8_GIBSU|nr:uncharacterized protein FSUBG_3940 [Fusarium subglutinans]KAF5609466.1 hypothetical protein FSUBG_3940 [Fusarium subglutinans]
MKFTSSAGSTGTEAPSPFMISSPSSLPYDSEYPFPLNVRADLWYSEIPSLVLYSLVFFLSKHYITVARDKTPGTGGQRVYCPFRYFAFFASVLRLKALLSSRPYHTYLMDWTIPFCRMKIPISSLGSEPIYPATLPTPPIPLTAQVCTSSNSRPTRKDHGNHNSPSWVFQTGHPYCPTSSLSYELHIIDTSDTASTLTEHSSGDGEPSDQPTLETRSQEDREGGLQQEVELRVTCNLIDFVVVILTLVICALLMAAVRQNVNQDSLVAPADMRFILVLTSTVTFLEGAISRTQTVCRGKQTNHSVRELKVVLAIRARSGFG